MDYELIFSVAGLLATIGWLLLLASPILPKWSDRLAGLVIPVALSISYCALIIVAPPEGGGFGSLAEVAELFSEPQALLAGWIHFLAFDLFIGAWICRRARSEEIPFWLVLPCLPMTFLFGPAGFLAFSMIRGVKAARSVKNKNAL
ncbi:MAG: ABA4-like family protein [Pseudomonadota bacterium]